MMNYLRAAMLVFLICFSSLFMASLAYSVCDTLQGGSMQLNIPLFLNSLLWCSGALVIALLICVSPFGDKIVSLFFATRKQSLREEQKINPAIERIKDLYRQKHGCELDINVCIMDEPHINGMALGRQTAAVSTGLLKVGSEDEIAGVLAHEAGHLHHKDSVLALALLVAGLPTLALNYILRFFFLSSPKPNAAPSGGQDFGWVIGMCILILFLMFFAYFIVFWVLSFPVLWLMRGFEVSTQWKIEYRADEFAMHLGYAPALIELFERIEDEDIRNSTGFLSKYLYSHPPTALRIDRLERKLQGEENARYQD